MKAIIRESKLSCVRKDAEGTIVGQMPGGWAVLVPYFLTGLFGGQVDGEATFYFENHEVEIVSDPVSSPS